jgi:SEC-C motif/Protein of unknown function (DUF2384)
VSDMPGRNEPCPCGSGKKYKNCCIKAAVQELQAAHAHEGAVPRAMDWLARVHRKAFAAALQRQIEAAASACFNDDMEATQRALDALDGEAWQQVQINLSEWLLAEGDIEAKGAERRVSELLLGPGGPLFEAAQRAWLEQLAQRPLRLYDITEVIPGRGLTLCDALDTAAAPTVVVERAGSRTLKVGMQIGARLMQVADGWQLSGAVYPFSMLSGRALHDALRAMAAMPGPHAQDYALMFGLRIIEHWLAQFLKPPALPDFVHAASGEPLLFTTDHYEVLDWPALEAALAAQPDVKGQREPGWDRLVEGGDGLQRSLVTVEPGPGERRVKLLTQTASQAGQVRPWFEALAGGAVKFVLRDVSDPKGMLSRADPAGAVNRSAPALPDGLDPKTLADVIAGMIKRSYANWADEPIPALGGQTPRQAIGNAAGLERVKGLLRSYEDGEADQAATQGRSPISYQFLWDALGLQR